jgi:hypothetical protein
VLLPVRLIVAPVVTLPCTPPSTSRPTASMPSTSMVMPPELKTETSAPVTITAVEPSPEAVSTEVAPAPPVKSASASMR